MTINRPPGLAKLPSPMANPMMKRAIIHNAAHEMMKNPTDEIDPRQRFKAPPGALGAAMAVPIVIAIIVVVVALIAIVRPALFKH